MIALFSPHPGKAVVRVASGTTIDDPLEMGAEESAGPSYLSP